MPTDLRSDPSYLDQRIKHISDAELLFSLDLTLPELRDISLASSRKDYAGAYQAWARHWDRVASARALFGDGDDFLVPRDKATQSFINGKDAVITAADRVLRHDIQGWGPTSIQHGPVVDFNADYGQSGKYGFHYWGFARPLTRAFLVSGDEKYLDEFQALFNSWYEQRDKVKGGFSHLDVIYYELGLGVRHRVFFEYYALPHAKRTPQTHERMLKAALGAARWLHEEQKLGYRPHNWQMIGSFGLAQIGLMLPEFRESGQWIDLGVQRVLEHLDKDFFPDGCFSERCPASYNIIAFRDPHNLGVLLATNSSHRELAKKLHAPLDAQANFLTNVAAPDGYLPGINDGSRTLLLPSIRAACKQKPESSVHFAPSGFTVMRSSATRDAVYMLINHGPSGGGHSHADMLSFELHAFGQPLAIDAGIGDTYDDPLWSSWYVHAKAHNMLTVDLEDPDRFAAAATDVAWESSDRFDHFAGTHHGYEKSKGIVHRRHVLFVKPHYFIVRDVIDARAAQQQHSIEWNLHPTVPLDKPTGPGLIVAPSENWPSHSQPAWAGVAGIPGFEDKNQAQIEWLRFAANIQPGEQRCFAVLLFPCRGQRPDVTLKTTSPNEFTVGNDVIRFAERSATLSRINSD